MKGLMLAFVATGLLTAPALAVPCRDGKGKFIKCATAAKPAATKCRDAKGHFAKCPAK